MSRRSMEAKQSPTGGGASFQRSDSAYFRHLERIAQQGGSGPSLLPNHSVTSSPTRKNSEIGDTGFHDDSGRRLHYAEPQSPSKHGLETMNSRSTRNQSISSSRAASLNVKKRQHLAVVRKTIGLAPEAPIVEDHHVHTHLGWSSIRNILREPFAEFFGTFILILFGDGSVAQVLLSTGQTNAPGGMGFGNYQSISWGWGIGIMLGIYVAGDSGGFLNPAVTLAFSFYRRFPFRRVPVYMLAQILGAFCAAGVVYANYVSAIDQFEGGAGIRTVGLPTSTAGIFATYPQPFLNKANQFFSEFIASTILMFVILALKDDSNPGAMGKTGAGMLFPLALFFLVFGIGAAFGWETGYAINLARDFGPRLMTYALGYGSGVWTAGGHYFWVPMVAPFAGCLFGGALYDIFVYTGPESPINTPWLGMKGLFTGRWDPAEGNKEAEGEADLERGETRETRVGSEDFGKVDTAVA